MSIYIQPMQQSTRWSHLVLRLVWYHMCEREKETVCMRACGSPSSSIRDLHVSAQA
jgi:hypothetical protein